MGFDDAVWEPIVGHGNRLWDMGTDCGTWEPIVGHGNQLRDMRTQCTTMWDKGTDF